MRAVGRVTAGLLAAVAFVSGCTTSTVDPPVATTTTGVPPAVTADPTTAAPETGGTLRYALAANPSSIDPRFLADDEGTVVADAIFDSLVAWDGRRDAVVPAAASSWKVSDDGLTYTFSLREGATYHDGSPVVARDFVRSFRRIVDREATPTSFLHYQLAPVRGYDRAVAGEGPLAGVKALNPTTLRIRLARPMAEFLLVLAHPSLAPIPPKADERRAAFAEAPIGNGPFVMAEPWQPNQFIRVTRFEDHVDPPELDEVVFQIFADDPSRQQQYGDFERGQLDVADVPPASIEEAIAAYGRSSSGYTGPGVLTGITGALYAFGFNTELPPFDDPAVRRAVSQVIDRERIVEQITLGTRAAATTLVPPSLPGGAPGRCQHCRFDPDAARAELGLPPAASDAPDGPSPGPTDDAASIGPIEIVVNDGATNERIAARVAADLERHLGIDVSTRTAPPEEFVTQVRAGEVQLFRLGWQADYPSPGAVLQPLFHSGDVGADNLTRFADEQVDALLDEARGTEDPAARRELYAQAEQRVLRLAPVTPVFFYRHTRVVADTVEGLRLGPLGSVNWSEISKREPA